MFSWKYVEGSFYKKLQSLVCYNGDGMIFGIKLKFPSSAAD